MNNEARLLTEQPGFYWLKFECRELTTMLTQPSTFNHR